MPDILALDPGERTGFALLRGSVLVRIGVLPVWEQTQPDYLCLADLMHLFWDGVVVAERFASRTLTREGQHTLKVLGVIEYLCAVELPHLTLIYQAPESRTPFLADHAFPLLIPYLFAYKREQHPFDALAHALRYLAAQSTPPEAVSVSPSLCVVGMTQKKVHAP